ncbi:uncharacterized protein C8A04DRAFT_31736 [Dichotomopilus funicola]|uniref:Uncharacterized protein n=1 Tax=Dichotomopilus funicola TaxID=1934379 RepID=A0AAN6UZI1_9PEZI|nr:hypothetical protein C8A04DRAFT_31736 [Dichotomopilus funicola]
MATSHLKRYNTTIKGKVPAASAAKINASPSTPPSTRQIVQDCSRRSQIIPLDCVNIEVSNFPARFHQRPEILGTTVMPVDYSRPVDHVMRYTLAGVAWHFGLDGLEI